MSEEAKPVPGSTVEDRIQRALSSLPSKSAEPAKETAPPAAEAAEAEAEEEAPETPKAATEPPAAPDKPPAAPPKATEDQPAPNKDDAELRAARAARAAQQKEREAYEANKARKELESQLADLRAQVEKEKAWRTKSPLELLQDRGLTYEQLTKEIVEGKHKPLSPEQLAVQETRSIVDQLKAELQAEKEAREAERRAIAEEREKAAKEQQAEATATHISGKLKEHADKFPVLATLPWAAKTIVREAERTGKTYDEIALEMESAARNDVQTVFSSDETLKVFLGDEATKQRVLSILGIKPQPASPASDEGSNSGRRKGATSAIPQTRSSDPGTRTKAPKLMSTEDRIRAGLERLASKQSG